MLVAARQEIGTLNGAVRTVNIRSVCRLFCSHILLRLPGVIDFRERRCERGQIQQPAHDTPVVKSARTGNVKQEAKKEMSSTSTYWSYPKSKKSSPAIMPTAIWSLVPRSPRNMVTAGPLRSVYMDRTGGRRRYRCTAQYSLACCPSMYGGGRR